MVYGAADDFLARKLIMTLIIPKEKRKRNNREKFSLKKTKRKNLEEFQIRKTKRGRGEGREERGGVR